MHTRPYTDSLLKSSLLWVLHEIGISVLGAGQKMWKEFRRCSCCSQHNDERSQVSRYPGLVTVWLSINNIVTTASYLIIDVFWPQSIKQFLLGLLQTCQEMMLDIRPPRLIQSQRLRRVNNGTRLKILRLFGSLGDFKI